MPKPVQDEDEVVRFNQARKLLRRWFDGWGHESAIIRQLLMDYARVVERAERDRLEFEWEIARLQREQQAWQVWLESELLVRVARLRAIGADLTVTASDEQP